MSTNDVSRPDTDSVGQNVRVVDGVRLGFQIGLGFLLAQACVGGVCLMLWFAFS